MKLPPVPKWVTAFFLTSCLSILPRLLGPIRTSFWPSGHACRLAVVSGIQLEWKKVLKEELSWEVNSLQKFLSEAHRALQELDKFYKIFVNFAFASIARDKNSFIWVAIELGNTTSLPSLFDTICQWICLARPSSAQWGFFNTPPVGPFATEIFFPASIYHLSHRRRVSYHIIRAKSLPGGSSSSVLIQTRRCGSLPDCPPQGRASWPNRVLYNQLVTLVCEPGPRTWVPPSLEWGRSSWKFTSLLSFILRAVILSWPMLLLIGCPVTLHCHRPRVLLPAPPSQGSSTCSSLSACHLVRPFPVPSSADLFISMGESHPLIILRPWSSCMLSFSKASGKLPLRY